MATLEQSLQPVDRERLTQIDTQPATSPAAPAPAPTMDKFLVCAMPPVQAYPDTLRQFYRDGIPQYRLLPAKPLYL